MAKTQTREAMRIERLLRKISTVRHTEPAAIIFAHGKAVNLVRKDAGIGSRS
jgi:hypothetical protein